jgi:hypothetical protein
MKNRITQYEAGWLSMLLDKGLATREELIEAQNRIAQAAIKEIEREQKRRGKTRRRRKS